MQYKIIKDGVTVNTIEADEAFCAAYCAEHGYTCELLPEPEPAPSPTPENPEADAMEAVLDLKVRVIQLELGTNTTA